MVNRLELWIRDGHAPQRTMQVFVDPWPQYMNMFLPERVVDLQVKVTSVSAGRDTDLNNCYQKLYTPPVRRSEVGLANHNRSRQ